MMAAVTSRVSRVGQGAVRRIDRRRFDGPAPSVVSDDCWTVGLYRHLGLPYSTPFVGLFVMAEDYLPLVSDLSRLPGWELEFLPRSRHESIERLRASGELPPDYPVGLLDGRIEIQFQHYADEAEVREKWWRRMERFDPTNAFVKFDGSRHGSSAEHRRAYDALPLPRKIMFVRDPEPELESAVHVRRWHQNGLFMFERAGPDFDVIDWFSGGSGRVNGTRSTLRRIALRGTP